VTHAEVSFAHRPGRGFDRVLEHGWHGGRSRSDHDGRAGEALGYAQLWRRAEGPGLPAGEPKSVLDVPYDNSTTEALSPQRALRT
jgi:hypothetical protein